MVLNHLLADKPKKKLVRVHSDPVVYQKPMLYVWGKKSYQPTPYLAENEI